MLKFNKGRQSRPSVAANFETNLQPPGMASTNRQSPDARGLTRPLTLSRSCWIVPCMYAFPHRVMGVSKKMHVCAAANQPTSSSRPNTRPSISRKLVCLLRQTRALFSGAGRCACKVQSDTMGSLANLRRSETAGELMPFLHAVDWKRTSLPRMAEVVAPLREFQIS